MELSFHKSALIYSLTNLKIFLGLTSELGDFSKATEGFVRGVGKVLLIPKDTYIRYCVF